MRVLSQSEAAAGTGGIRPEREVATVVLQNSDPEEAEAHVTCVADPPDASPVSCPEANRLDLSPVLRQTVKLKIQ